MTSGTHVAGAALLQSCHARNVGALLGHSSPKTTARYTHLADHPLKSAADRISEAIERYLADRAPDLADLPLAVEETSGYASEAEKRPELDAVLGGLAYQVA